MKEYISPEMICIDLNTENIILGASKDTPKVTVSFSMEGKAQNEGDFASSAYRSNLWED